MFIAHRLVLVAAAALTTVTSVPPVPSKTAARVVTIVARDYAFDAPDTISAGRTQVRLSA